MPTRKLISLLKNSGVTLAFRGDRLTYEGNESALTATVMVQLKERKAEIIRELRSEAKAKPVEFAALTIPQLLIRLRRGTTWITDQTQKFILDDPTAASDEEFSRALEAWDLMERQVRKLGYTNRCASFTGGCPEDVQVRCAWCVLQAELTENG